MRTEEQEYSGLETIDIAEYYEQQKQQAEQPPTMINMIRIVFDTQPVLMSIVAGLVGAYYIFASLYFALIMGWLT